jgi:hypothetical protein
LIEKPEAVLSENPSEVRRDDTFYDKLMTPFTETQE